MGKNIELLLKPTPEERLILKENIDKYKVAVYSIYERFISENTPKIDEKWNVPLLSSKEIDADLTASCKARVALDARVMIKKYYSDYISMNKRTQNAVLPDSCSFGLSGIKIKENMITIPVKNHGESVKLQIMTDIPDDTSPEYINKNISSATISLRNDKFIATIFCKNTDKIAYNGFRIDADENQSEILDMMIDSYSTLYDKLLTIAQNDESYLRYGSWNDFTTSSHTTKAKYSSCYDGSHLTQNCRHALEMHVRAVIREQYDKYKKTGKYTKPEAVKECHWLHSGISFKDGNLLLPTTQEIDGKRKSVVLSLKNDASAKNQQDITDKNFSVLCIIKDDKGYLAKYFNITNEQKRNISRITIGLKTVSIDELKERAENNNTYLTKYLYEMANNPKFVVVTEKEHDYTAKDVKTAEKIEKIMEKLQIPYRRDGKKITGNLSEKDFDKIATYY